MYHLKISVLCIATKMLCIATQQQSHKTYREGSVGVDLILGSDAEASVAVAGGPGQIYGRLQVIVHLLINGPTELCAIIPEN